VEMSLAPGFPSAQESDGTFPPTVIACQWTMHLVAITQGHVDHGPSKGLVLLTFVRLAIHEAIKSPHRIIHEPCAFPLERKIRIRREMNSPRAQLPEFLNRLHPKELLLFRPDQVGPKLARIAPDRLIHLIHG